MSVSGVKSEQPALLVLIHHLSEARAIISRLLLPRMSQLTAPLQYKQGLNYSLDLHAFKVSVSFPRQWL